MVSVEGTSVSLIDFMIHGCLWVYVFMFDSILSFLVSVFCFNSFGVSVAFFSFLFWSFAFLFCLGQNDSHGESQEYKGL